MQSSTFSAHTITDPHQPGFDPAEYSRFKYGDDRPAADFGKYLAKKFIEELQRDRYDGTQLVVLSSPYSFLPTATFAMKRHFVRHLNRWLARHHFIETQEAKIHRTITYKEDYGALDAEQRLQLISNDSFELDAEFLQGKILVFLDDIRITGSHERMILRTARKYALTNRAYLGYFAILENREIHPRYENYLNYYAISELNDLDDLVEQDYFRINTRCAKFILNAELSAFDEFIDRRSESFKQLLLDSAIGNGYHRIEAYSANFKKLERLVEKMEFAGFDAAGSADS